MTTTAPSPLEALIEGKPQTLVLASGDVLLVWIEDQVLRCRFVSTPHTWGQLRSLYGADFARLVLPPVWIEEVIQKHLQRFGEVIQCDS